MPLESPDEDEILRKESEMNFAQRPRYLLKFAQKQYSFKKFLAAVAFVVKARLRKRRFARVSCESDVA